MFQVIKSLSESSHVDETRRQELVAIYENTVDYVENIGKMDDPIVDELKKMFPGFDKDLCDHKLKAAETIAPVLVLGLYQEKTCLRGLRPRKTQTGLLSNKDKLLIGLVYFTFKGCLVNFFIFILFQTEIPVSKQCRP